jgi:hypothetical protein
MTSQGVTFQEFHTESSFASKLGTSAVTMKNGAFWDVMPCGSCKNRRFGGT